MTNFIAFSLDNFKIPKSLKSVFTFKDAGKLAKRSVTIYFCATFWIPNDCIQCRGIREIQNNAIYLNLSRVSLEIPCCFYVES